MKNVYHFEAKMWIYSGHAAWHFITLQKELSKELTDNFGVLKRGWGSLPVTVKIGKTSWETSIFPDKKIDAYLLPVKSIVRKKENLKAGDNVSLELKIKV